ncbi:unnamed protein product [Acanthoscelides obtectus]|uniref:Uncharacterized protein n=1 Tax=Acanthoscelides obtectus TaxID=200917 RepID=A0A9P0PR35_ACAOB|nr:unnamed protein product [Acanthoscelides obtectus]CAK1684297.1 hypothetical protein AOBTE_LOCUS34785 [Acanthoscelides obtectus]
METATWSLSRQKQSQLKAEVFRDTVILVYVSSGQQSQLKAEVFRDSVILVSVSVVAVTVKDSACGAEGVENVAAIRKAV